MMTARAMTVGRFNRHLCRFARDLPISLGLDGAAQGAPDNRVIVYGEILTAIVRLLDSVSQLTGSCNVRNTGNHLHSV
jgi:hypothetical protein